MKYIQWLFAISILALLSGCVYTTEDCGVYGCNRVVTTAAVVPVVQVVNRPYCSGLYTACSTGCSTYGAYGVYGDYGDSCSGGYYGTYSNWY